MYEKYPLLWNIMHKDYSNIKLKDEIFKSFYLQLESQGLIEEMDKKQLKAKIMNIKDVYRNERAKIEKSRKIGSATDDIYHPKLVWFDRQTFYVKCYLQETANQIW